MHHTRDEELTDLSLTASLWLLATLLFPVRPLLYPTLSRNVIVLNFWLRLLLLLLSLDSCLYTFMFEQICLYCVYVCIDYREFNFLFFLFGLGVCIVFAEPWQRVVNDGWADQLQCWRSAGVHGHFFFFPTSTLLACKSTKSSWLRLRSLVTVWKLAVGSMGSL